MPKKLNQADRIIQNMAKALITGITGQDGVFLSKFLLGKGYEVYGVARMNSQATFGGMYQILGDRMARIRIYRGDVTDPSFIVPLIAGDTFGEIYHLAAQSSVGYSFNNPKYTFDVNVTGTLNMLEAVRLYSPDSRIYFAATSELFGKPEAAPQNESTPFRPIGPYAISKLSGYYLACMYRKAYGIFISNGICFNHESEIRGSDFVTRKVSWFVANAAINGLKNPLLLGNLDAVKDWGYSPDFVKGMWLALQHPEPDDYVFGTGESHTVRELVAKAFDCIGMSIEWSGKTEEKVTRLQRTPSRRLLPYSR
ncbi:MAG: GDP-mannose 4,6-dehydratase [Candidatus Thermoplasmatota archaeon]|nr:GDP-mannose 4,6-dehydratase [Candidatus Thermoplasmatota archaeon]